MRSRKDIYTSGQILQSPQRRMMNPKAGREEKDTQDGKGKDHQLSQPSRQTTLQPNGLQLRPRRPDRRGRTAMAAFPRHRNRRLWQNTEGLGRDRVNPRKRAHRNGRCLFQGQAPDQWILMCWFRILLCSFITSLPPRLVTPSWITGSRNLNVPSRLRQFCSWNLNSWKVITQPEYKLRKMRKLRQGPVCLQETKWNGTQAEAIHQNIPGIQISSSNATPNENGELTGGVAILLPQDGSCSKKLSWLKEEPLPH